jgi:hypothetical protein
MKTSLKAFGPNALVILAALSLAACDKVKSIGENITSATTTTNASTSSGCAKFAEKASADAKPDRKEDNRKVGIAICEAVSEPTRTCLIAANAKADVDACLAANPADKDKATGAAFAAAMAAEREAAAKPPAPFRIEKLGLQIDVAGRPSAYDGFEKGEQRVTGVAGMSVTVAEATARKTLGAAQAEATSIFKGSNVQSGTLADGYWLVYEAPGFGKGEKSFSVKTQRQIGKKSYVCEASGMDKKNADAALAACKSLTLAPPTT